MLAREQKLAAVPVQAKAVSIYDVTTDTELYGKNQNIPLPLASLAKSLSISVALNNYKTDDTVYISKNALAQDGDFGLFLNEKWNVDDLAKFSLIESANDGAYAISENDPNILNEINARAEQIGMQHALFLNTTGLDLDQTHAGVFASAQDANLMASYALQAWPDIFSATTLPSALFKSESGFAHTAKNTDIILNQIPNIIFSKTGYTDIAGGNLTVIFKNKTGDEIAVTVLGSTFDGRFSDMANLVNAFNN